MDGAAVECTNCAYKFEGTKTPVVKHVAPLSANSAATVTINGTNLCS